jgi:hypothetical protein
MFHTEISLIAQELWTSSRIEKILIDRRDVLDFKYAGINRTSTGEKRILIPKIMSRV